MECTRRIMRRRRSIKGCRIICRWKAICNIQRNVQEVHRDGKYFIDDYRGAGSAGSRGSRRSERSVKTREGKSCTGCGGSCGGCSACGDSLLQRVEFSSSEKSKKDEIRRKLSGRKKNIWIRECPAVTSFASSLRDPLLLYSGRNLKRGGKVKYLTRVRKHRGARFYRS